MDKVEKKKRYCYKCKKFTCADNITLSFKFYYWECEECHAIHKRKCGK